MSDDGCYIVCQNWKYRFFYVRWGGSYIDRDLLCGPKSFLDFVCGLTVTPEPFGESWVS